jgi:hypothetical protein
VTWRDVFRGVSLVEAVNSIRCLKAQSGLTLLCPAWAEREHRASIRAATDPAALPRAARALFGELQNGRGGDRGAVGGAQSSAARLVRWHLSIQDHRSHFSDALGHTRRVPHVIVVAPFLPLRPTVAAAFKTRQGFTDCDDAAPIALSEFARCVVRPDIGRVDVSGNPVEKGVGANDATRGPSGHSSHDVRGPSSNVPPHRFYAPLPLAAPSPTGPRFEPLMIMQRASDEQSESNGMNLAQGGSFVLPELPGRSDLRRYFGS